jgi:hypothetical protein
MTEKEETPARVAWQAASLVQTLNHMTLSCSYEGGGWYWPSDAYSLAGGLNNLAANLPQLLEQTGGFIEKLHAAGHVGSDRGPEAVDGLVAECTAAVGEARRAALRLQDCLERLHGATSSLTYED